MYVCNVIIILLVIFTKNAFCQITIDQAAASVCYQKHVILGFVDGIFQGDVLRSLQYFGNNQLHKGTIVTSG